MKKNIYLVPHTHWDREWYFTFDTGNVLLHNALGDLKFHQEQKWLLDGQWSLIDDYLLWNPDQKDHMTSLLKKQDLVAGPLYSQPDVFNSLGETIIRNFQIGQMIADRLQVPQPKTAYLPDTFGFGANFPQLLNHAGIKNFVFWRGAPAHQLEKSDFFQWKGLNDASVNAYILRKGYYALGMYFPYNHGRIYPEKNNPHYFLEKIDKYLAQVQLPHQQNITLPLGGDQAPFIVDQQTFVNKLNQVSDKYHFKLIGHYDHFFKTNVATSTYQGDLRTPITGKIHRTITSSRYDIKKSFREAENELYHLLEPLEIFYQQFDRSYQFENYKIQNILKPLFIAQTHDSLGGCNTDQTNDFQLQRIEAVRENILAQVDLLLKKIIQEQKIANDHLVIFNPAPFVNTIMSKKIIYSSSQKIINYDQKNFSIRTLKSKNISFTKDKPLFKQEVLIVAKNLAPLSLTTFNLEKSNTNLEQENFHVHNNNAFELPVGDKLLKFKFKIIEDQGDSYDFSPGAIIPVTLVWQQSQKYVIGKTIVYDLQGKLNNSPIRIMAFNDQGEWEFDIDFDNKIKNAKCSLLIEAKTIKKSLNLAFYDFTKNQAVKDWPNKYREFPVDSDANDGLVQVDDINILTSGTNEILRHQHHLELTWFRSYGYVTRNHLAWRQSTSGLSWKEESPRAQLQKKLKFNFKLTTQKPINALNIFKYRPYIYKVQTRNFIANKMNKFVVNNILDPQLLPISLQVDPQVFISSMRQVDQNIKIRVANMIDQQKKAHININGDVQEITLNPFEIKEIVKQLKEKHE